VQVFALLGKAGEYRALFYQNAIWFPAGQEKVFVGKWVYWLRLTAPIFGSIDFSDKYLSCDRGGD
jgi:hypothetical protein